MNSTVASTPLAPRNAEFERGDWVKSIIWDQGSSYRNFTALDLNLNDPQMLLEIQATGTTGELFSQLLVVPGGNAG